MAQNIAHSAHTDSHIQTRTRPSCICPSMSVCVHVSTIALYIAISQDLHTRGELTTNIDTMTSCSFSCSSSHVLTDQPPSSIRTADAKYRYDNVLQHMSHTCDNTCDHTWFMSGAAAPLSTTNATTHAITHGTTSSAACQLLLVLQSCYTAHNVNAMY